MMLAKFRHRYPQGSLVSELVKIDRGTYIVKALVQIDRIVLATALASGATVEAAEDAAKSRAIASLFLDDIAGSSTPPVPIDTPSDAANPSSTERNSTSPHTPSNHQIVNFSKPQPQPTTAVAKASPMPTRDSQNEPIDPTPTAVDDTPVQQLNVDTVPTISSPEPSSNLFGDTSNAASPTLDNPVSYSADSVSPPASNGESEAMDFNEIKQKTDIEIKRLGWTKEQGRDFLMSRYGKRSRLHLKDEQLIEFLHYLENLPNPVK